MPFLKDHIIIQHKSRIVNPFFEKSENFFLFFAFDAKCVALTFFAQLHML